MRIDTQSSAVTSTVSLRGARQTCLATSMSAEEKPGVPALPTLNRRAVLGMAPALATFVATKVSLGRHFSCLLAYCSYFTSYVSGYLCT